MGMPVAIWGFPFFCGRNLVGDRGINIDYY